MKEKLKIKLERWESVCADGCCHDWGLRKTINGVELFNQNDDVGFAIQDILEHLGYEVELEEIFTDKDGNSY